MAVALAFSAGCHVSGPKLDNPGFRETTTGKNICPSAAPLPFSTFTPPPGGPAEPIAITTGPGSDGLPSAPKPLRLRLQPGSVQVASNATLDLRAQVRVFAEMDNSTLLEVTREATYAIGTGGSLEGTVFRPTPGATTASVNVRWLPAGGTLLQTTLSIAILQLPRSLTLNRDELRVTAGTLVALRQNVGAVVTLEDGSTAEVSREVQYRNAVGGQLLVGDFLLADPTPITGSIDVVYSLLGRIVSNRLGVIVQEAAPSPVSLSLVPPSLDVDLRAGVDVRSEVKALATLNDVASSQLDVTAAVGYTHPVNGFLTGSRFTPSPGFTSGSVDVVLATEATPLTRTLPLRYTQPQPQVLSSLTATATVTAIAARVDLRHIIAVTATFTTTPSRDVSGEVTYSNEVGGTRDGTSFNPLPGQSLGGVDVEYASGGQARRATVRFAIRLPTGPAAVLRLELDPSALTMTAGGTLDLLRSVAVTAVLTDGGRPFVSDSVQYTATTGTLLGNLYVAPVAPGPVTLTATYASGGATASAALAVSVLPGEAAPTSLTLAPSRVHVSLDGRLHLPAAVQATATLVGGATRDVTRDVTFSDPVRGTLSGNEFVPTARGTGSVRVTLATLAGPLVVLLPIDVLDTQAAVPVALVLDAGRLAIVAGATADLRQSVRGVASFSDGTSEDVSRELVFSTPSGGTLAGTVFRPDGTTGTGSVVAEFSRAGLTIRRLLEFPIARGQRVPIDLLLVPGTIGVAVNSRCDLSLAVRCLALFSDGLQEDVTRDVRYAAATGGTLAGRVFQAGATVLDTFVDVQFTSGGFTVRKLLTIRLRPDLPAVTALFLSPSEVHVVEGGEVGLTYNVKVTAAYDDGTVATVGSGVDWAAASGGRILDSQGGVVFRPDGPSGTATATARYTAGGMTRSAQLAIRILPAHGAPVGLLLRPQQVTVAPGSSLLLPANVQVLLQRLDGVRDDVTRQVRWTAADGGTLSATAFGPAFVAGRQSGFGSVSAVLEDSGTVLVATLHVIVSEASLQAKALRAATVGLGYTGSLAELLGPGLLSGLEVHERALAPVGLTVRGEGQVAGTPTTSALLAFTVSASTTQAAFFDTCVLDTRPAAPRPDGP